MLNIGMMPDGHPFFSSTDSTPDIMEVGVRIGPGALHATLGLYHERQGFMPLPDVADPGVFQIDDFRLTRPGIVVV